MIRTSMAAAAGAALHTNHRNGRSTMLGRKKETYEDIDPGELLPRQKVVAIPGVTLSGKNLTVDDLQPGPGGSWWVGLSNGASYKILAGRKVTVVAGKRR